MSQFDYSSLARIFENYLIEHQVTGNPDTLYAPIRYINSIGGKRIRPVLLLMAYNLWHDDVTPALPAALAMEYFHNFSLMHDDIMDEATTRRGHESVHVRYGRNLAILSGDAMLIKCFELLLESGKQNNTSSIICAEMSATALTICEGQQMDMDFEMRDSPSEQDYLEMIRRKTASLLGTCLKIGALFAGASADIADKMYSCGENIGISFQIKDDLLDVFGEAELTGKQKGGDILRGKKNFLYVHTFNSLEPSEKEEFIHAYHDASKTGNINPILEEYQSINVEMYARQLQQQYFAKALASIEHLNLFDTSLLVSFAEELMSRDH